MSSSPDIPFDVFVCFGPMRGTLFPHWMLMLMSRNAPSRTGTWFHATGGPSQNKQYEVTIQANKSYDSPGIASKKLLGHIKPNDFIKVKDAAKRIQAQQCQTYIVALVAELERLKLLPLGNAINLNTQVQMSEDARTYALQHPVKAPKLIGAENGSGAGSNSGSRPGRSQTRPKEASGSKATQTRQTVHSMADSKDHQGVQQIDKAKEGQRSQEAAV